MNYSYRFCAIVCIFYNSIASSFELCVLQIWKSSTRKLAINEGEVDYRKIFEGLLMELSSDSSVVSGTHTRLSWYCLEHGIGWWAIPDAVAKVSQRTLFYWHRCESQLKNILLLLWNISVAFSNKIFPRLKSLFLRIFQTTIFDLFPILSGINTYRYRRKIHDTSKAFILHTSLLQ